MSPALIDKSEPRDLRPICNRCFTRHWPTEPHASFFSATDQYGQVVISPPPKAREPMGHAILREAQARMGNRMTVPRPIQEAKTDDRVLKENTKVSWTSGICVVCYDVRYPGRMPTRVKDNGREQCCDCGMPTTDGIYMRADPMTVRYPRVVGE